MRKILHVFIILLICLLFTSVSGRVLQDKGDLSHIHTLEPDTNEETLNEIINQIENYHPEYNEQVDIKIMSLVSKCMGSLIIDYDRLEQLIANDDDKIIVKVTSVDIEKLIFVNTLSTNYNNYKRFLSNADINFVNQLDEYQRISLSTHMT